MCVWINIFDDGDILYLALAIFLHSSFCHLRPQIARAHLTATACTVRELT